MLGKRTGKLKVAAPRERLARPGQRAFNTRLRAPGHVFAKAVGSFVPGLTCKAFEKFGFSAATLLTDWAEIAGAELAGRALPERLKWPRGAGTGADEGSEGRPGATLYLRVDPAHALDIEYRSRQIVERINAYFGYRAVAQLRLVQAPLARAEPAAAPAPASALPANPTAGSGDPLSRALARLEAGVKGQFAARPRAV